MKKEVILPALALVGGAAGFGLRQWELSAALDPSTGLMAMDCPATWLLVILTAALVAAFAALCQGAGGQKLTPQQRFQAPVTIYITLVVVSSMLLLVSAGAGAVLMQGTMGAGVNVSTAVLAVLSLVSGLAQLVLGKQLYRRKWDENIPILIMLPAFWALGRLVLTYQDNSRQPVLLLYVYPILAAVCVLLGLYGLASLSLDKGGPTRTCVFCLVGTYLSLVALAGEPGLVGKLQYLSAALYLTAQSYMLLRGAFGPPWPKRLLERMPEGAEESESSTASPAASPEQTSEGAEPDNTETTE